MSDNNNSTTQLSLLRRIELSRPIWFQADIDRVTALLLLLRCPFAKTGVFVIRNSISTTYSHALSILNDCGGCSHYLIKYDDANETFTIDSSSLSFPSLSSLILYYCEHLDDFPFYLQLPDPILAAKDEDELKIINSQGVDFWCSDSTHLLPPNISLKEDDVCSRKYFNRQGSSDTKSTVKLRSSGSEEKLSSTELDSKPKRFGQIIQSEYCNSIVLPRDSANFLISQVQSALSQNPNSKNPQFMKILHKSFSVRNGEKPRLVRTQFNSVFPLQAPANNLLQAQRHTSSSTDLRSLEIDALVHSKKSSISEDGNDNKGNTEDIIQLRSQTLVRSEIVSKRSLSIPNTFSDSDNVSIIRSSFVNMFVPYAERRKGWYETKETSRSDTGKHIINYLDDQYKNVDSMLSKTIRLFVICVKQSKETNPLNVLRNIRQFLEGFKRVIRYGDFPGFNEAVETERLKLTSGEELNVDNILEFSLHRYIFKPLKNHLMQLLISKHHRNGDIEASYKGMIAVKVLSAKELGVNPKFNPPDQVATFVLKELFTKMENAYSPLKKMEYLLNITKYLYANVTDVQTGEVVPANKIGGEDFLPILIYALSQCAMVSAELQTEYMLGTVAPHVLNGEGGYYLTSLGAAVDFIKRKARVRVMPLTPVTQSYLQPSFSDNPNSVNNFDPELFVEVLIYDYLQDSLTIKKFAADKDTVTVADICKKCEMYLGLDNAESQFSLFLMSVKCDFPLQPNMLLSEIIQNPFSLIDTHNQKVVPNPSFHPYHLIYKRQNCPSPTYSFCQM